MTSPSGEHNGQTTLRNKKERLEKSEEKTDWGPELLGQKNNGEQMELDLVRSMESAKQRD